MYSGVSTLSPGKKLVHEVKINIFKIKIVYLKMFQPVNMTE